ncbi:DUF5677 domain-containing protein [Shewanella xiamenensis]|uniref:DUF5677 domain-containing protein n=1 Tax=Shewanella xiamenensis TaxID=332186 RepID=UPI001C4E5AA4|nr:DUF5677 domain-containing protein [Shewanella xiamenensis]MBW0278183.1 hypothetical protein [Shewanella xiamenensis]MCT8873465.1 DUF5677 domain-containing protein [Shewanella xiamenensis]UWH41121.1 hypothetical protein KXJ80_17965 [Shewanella xiamenensis]
MRVIQDQFDKLIEDLIAANPEKVEELDIEKIISEQIPEFTKIISNSLANSKTEMLSNRRDEYDSFVKRNIQRWQSGFDLLETHVAICTEAGENINSEYRAQAVKKDDLVFDLLVRHHARSCHIANEILCLLKNGFSDAAHSRWRALHELSATAMFIFKHGQECAERFYFHDIVDSYDGMNEHHKYEDRLQAKGPKATDLENIKRAYDDIVNKYGKSYAGHYGWAAYLFPEIKRVGFGSIEKDVGLDHMRPYYKWASQNIHAGSKGLRNRLALAECKEDILVVGQSNSGMVDPAHTTAISLMQVTCTLLLLNPSIDSIVIMEIAKQYSDKVGEEFLNLSRHTDL